MFSYMSSHTTKTSNISAALSSLRKPSANSTAGSKEKSLKKVNAQNSRVRKGFADIINIPLLVVTVLLLVYGAIVIWSASLSIVHASLSRHLLGIAIGLAFAFAMWSFDYRTFANFSSALLIVDLIVIFLPYIPFLSYSAKGMTGWIKIPGIGLTFQPVEAAKLITMLYMASITAQYNGRIDTARDYAKLCGMLAIPFVAIILQGDLGSSLVVLCGGAVVIMMGGARKEWVLSTIAMLIGFVAIVLASDSIVDQLVGDANSLLQDYQMNRLLVFIDPEADTSGAGYNLMQSMIAVGSGGFFGKGIGNATQSGQGFLPEAHTDFVFALLSEEFGFIGSVVLVLLFFLMLIFALRIGMKCENVYGKLLISGIVGMWLFQILENIGMCIGMMPITGIPLPFISFGSSSMMMQLCIIGTVQSVWRHRSKAA